MVDPQDEIVGFGFIEPLDSTLVVHRDQRDRFPMRTFSSRH